ncbi:unnamed protein product [Diplocarpon coronariae]
MKLSIAVILAQAFAAYASDGTFPEYCAGDLAPLNNGEYCTPGFWPHCCNGLAKTNYFAVQYSCNSAFEDSGYTAYPKCGNNGLTC